MSDTRTKMFMFLVLFWFGLLMISHFFHVVVITDGDIDTVTGPKMLLDTMLFKHSSDMPYFFGGFLDIMAIFTIYITYTLVSPLD